MRPNSARLARFAAIGAVGIAVLAGGFYLFHRTGTEAAPPAPVRQAAQTQPAVDSSDVDSLPDETLSDRAFHLIAQAVRLADRGKIAEATAKLDEADKLVPGLSETAQGRRKVAALATPDGQFALQIARARIAVGNDDIPELDKALTEAARLKPGAPEIAELRLMMQVTQQKEARRTARIADLLRTMREAIARKDIAGADRAFNEASRTDVLDPALDQARVELAQAHEADGNMK